MKGTRDDMPSVAICQISAPHIIKKLLANILSKSHLFRRLVRVQTVLRRAASRVREVQDMEDLFHLVLSRRCEVFEEEHVFHPSELIELLKERTNIVIDQHIVSTHN